MRDFRGPRAVAALAWSIVAIASAWQLFHAPVIGISNNGDYSKVSGYYKLAPVIGWGPGESEFYIPEYEFSDRHLYRSQLTSSEHVFAWPAVKLSRLFFGRQLFDLRMLAAVKLIWLWAAAWCLLWALAASRNWIGLALATLWLSDASTICYLPGFYMDSAALLFAISLAASFAWWVQGRPWAALPTIVSALGLVMSKSQHAPLALVFAIAAIGFACWTKRWWVLTAALLVGFLGFRMLTETTSQYAAVPVFTLTFHRIAKTGDRMGLDDSYRRFEGMHAYSPGSPTEDKAWGDAFLKEVSLARIAAWYLTHPRETFGYLLDDWRRFSSIQPDAGLGWRRREDGFPPRSQTGGLTLWKSLREAAGPWGTLASFLAPVLAWRRREFWPIVLVLALATTEFAVASLADALETARHLYLFQVFADGLILSAIALLWTRLRNAS